jgi:predicted MPP superfamily phosphohydrolase
MTPVTVLDLGANGSLLVIDLLVVVAVWRWPGRSVQVCVWGATVAATLAVFGGFAWAREPFAAMRALSWVLFAHGPVDLLVAAALSFRVAPRQAGALAVAAVGTAVVAVDAFLVEPAALDVTYHELTTTKLEEPLRIAILADVQVERITDREWDALELAMDEEPDLILFAGDYLQLSDARESEYLLEAEAWKDLVQSTLEAPLGVYAVRGNAEVRSTWSPDLFAKTGITTFRETASVDLGPIVLTGLSFWDSFATTYSVDDTSKFHVILGHGPDFSLSPTARGDLLVAGHTHGGQVQVPFFGPLITYSEVPRAHAAGGLFSLSGDRSLVVSRGIGMERSYAPLLRFWCRPEIVIVDVIPEGWEPEE